ncbi:MAG TPA: hypothetical protein VFX97_16995 [Pyrinomonadaceae bacterium]|nr:hypothetical protein [Pyrinomonadaceae bacterium]
MSDTTKKSAVDFDATADAIFSRLADEFEAIDRKYGLKPYDYSGLRTPIAERRKARDLKESADISAQREA